MCRIECPRPALCRIAAPAVETWLFGHVNDLPGITYSIIVAEMPGSLCDANHTTQKKSIFYEKSMGLAAVRLQANGYFGITCIVMMIVASPPAVRLYETQYPAEGYLTSL